MRRIGALCAAFALALSGVIAAPRPASAVDIGQWHLNPGTGHFYAQMGSLPFDQAEAMAVLLGGHLVTINDAAEESWLEATFTDTYLWIGFTDEATEDTFVWTSGQPVSYTNWCPGEPDDWQGYGGEDFAAMNPDWEGEHCWIDADGAWWQGIVEVEKRPKGDIAAAPAGVNSFVGNFDITEWGSTNVVAHIVATVKEPTDAELVQSSVAIYWMPGMHGNVRESHAQVVEARFNDAVDAESYNHQAWITGVLCDYEGPQIGACQPFAMAFQARMAPALPDVVGFSLPGSSTCCDGDWYQVGKGSFTLNYVYDTPA